VDPCAWQGMAGHGDVCIGDIIDIHILMRYNKEEIYIYIILCLYELLSLANLRVSSLFERSSCFQTRLASVFMHQLHVAYTIEDMNAALPDLV
jgi:hypothetical protein